MTPTVRFSVEKVFDLPQRGGVLASGRVLAGSVSQGMVLRDEANGATTTVLGIEFPSPVERQTGRTTLVLERTAPSPVIAGRVLTSLS